MSYRPILFNTEMVKAILNNRKHSTRRIIKPQPPIDCHSNFIGAEWRNEPPSYYDTGDNNWACKYCGYGIGPGGKSIFHSPYQVGDILWVRETFAIGCISYGEEPDGTAVPYISQCTGENDIIPKEYAIRHNIGAEDVIWKPSIFMPRTAARIFLKVTNVKVQRVQDMTAHEAMQEGVWGILMDNKNPLYKKTYERGKYDEKTQAWYAGAIDAFATLWDSLYKSKGYGWGANPWVWAIEFERCEKPE